MRLKRIFGILFALVLALSLVVLPTGVVQAAPDLYEHYNTGDDEVASGPAGDWWYAQTFTAESDHSVTSVKLKLYRTGSPGTITVSIRATDNVTGHPIGTDLTSGTTNGDNLTTNTAAEWREIPLTSYDLSNDTQYAIVIRAPDAGSGTYPLMLFDGTSPTYAGGNMEMSGNAGNTWGGLYW